MNEVLLINPQCACSVADWEKPESVRVTDDDDDRDNGNRNNVDISLPVISLLTLTKQEAVMSLDAMSLLPLSPPLFLSQ